MNIVIPAAGKGSRFKNAGYTLPKPLISVDNKPMIIRAIETLNLAGRYIFILQADEYLNTIVKYIKEIVLDPIVIPIDYYTDGAARSVLLAETYINNTDELFVANCDQIMNYNGDIVGSLRKYDAGVVTINSTDNKHSYIQIKDDNVVRFAEKQVISEIALTGLHYWKHGCDFVSSAHSFINKTKPEYYIAPTYNELINLGKKIGIHMISNSDIHFIGTPEDLQIYESRKIIRS